MKRNWIKTYRAARGVANASSFVGSLDAADDGAAKQNSSGGGGGDATLEDMAGMLMPAFT